MTLAAGRSLSHYEILGPLGAGAMGEVYRARDTRLDREVALKVLPADLAGDAERLARFEREAKALAALQHPNIVTVHSIEHVDGVHFLTMELVEGETLAASIRRRRVPLDRFYPLAAAIADAVGAAHRKGITHRDLKPENVVVDAAGRPKVLDFGLAGIDPSARGAGAASSLTGEGLAMGTIPYMSPEALRAERVDTRSDVFSLGVVLYELLTGAHPFPAEDPGERISAILRDTPAPASDVRAVPPQLARLLRRCLEKDPERRLQSALDLRNELEEIAAEPDGEPPPSRRRPLRPLVVGGSALGLAIAVAVVSWTGRASSPDAYSLRRLTGSGANAWDPSWSPKGDTLLFARQEAGGYDLYSMRVGSVSGEPEPLLVLPGDLEYPRWSPLSGRIAYMSTREPGCPIFVLPAPGGEPRRLVDTNQSSLLNGDLPNVIGDRPWSSDEAWLLVSIMTGTGQLAVFQVDTNDPTRRVQLTTPPVGANDGNSTYSFDGTRIAFTRCIGDRQELWTMSRDGEDQAPLLTDFDNRDPAWRKGGDRIVFVSTRGGPNQGLWEVDVDDGSTRPLAIETKRVGSPTVSPDDQVAFVSWWHDTFLTVLDLETGVRKQVTYWPDDNHTPRFGPDGESIAYASDRSGGDDEIWIHLLDGRPETRVTSVPGADGSPDWSPDGERLVFVSSRDGAPTLFLTDRDGGRQVPLVSPGTSLPPIPGETRVRWSQDERPDDQLIAFVVAEEGGLALWCVRPDGTGARRLIAGVSDFDWYEGSHTVMFARAVGSENELWVQRLDGGAPRRLWEGRMAEIEVAPDGRSVAFLTGLGHMDMSLARLPLEPPADPGGLPALLDDEPEILVQAEGRWHVHLGGWSFDSKRFVYVHDEDYSDVFELVEPR